MKSETRVQSTSTSDIYTYITLGDFIRAVDKHYSYKVYSLQVTTKPSETYPHAVIPYKVTVKTFSRDLCTRFDEQRYLDMEHLMHMFQGIPLIHISSNDFENDEDTKQVETSVSFIDIDIIEYIRYSEHPELLTHPSRSFSVNVA